jgi:hypothetical protein
MTSHVTDFGVQGLSAVPYGVHMCQFYTSRDLLLNGLIPYFSTGRERNERCICVAAPPLPATEVASEVAKHAELSQALASGQLMILDAMEWYGDPAASSAEAIVQRWIDEEQRALADGYEGLRVTGNTAFFPRSQWHRLMAYETILHERIKGRRIIACCSYHREENRPVDILDVVRLHDGALDHGGKHWEVHLRHAKPELRRHHIRSAPDGITPNGITPNGITPNGITPNGITPNGLTPNGLTPNGLTPDGITPDGITPDGLTPNGIAEASGRR